MIPLLKLLLGILYALILGLPAKLFDKLTDDI